MDVLEPFVGAGAVERSKGGREDKPKPPPPSRPQAVPEPPLPDDSPEPPSDLPPSRS
jgi:hypothetical protein